MPLYDAYGNPIEPRGTGTTQPPALVPKRSLRRRLRQVLTWLQHLRPFWKVLASASVVATIFWAALAFRQEIVVDPYVPYDSSDPFSQRFSIVNNGPFSIYDVRYACAVTYLETNDPKLNATNKTLTFVMVPAAPHIPVINWKEKRSTDCDFIARFGPGMIAVRIEIEIFYHRWLCPWTVHGPGWKFSAKRDTTGKFIWDYGSPDQGIFDDEKRPVIFIPFSSDCCPFDPALLAKDISELSSVAAARKTHKRIVATMLPCGRPCNAIGQNPRNP